MSIDIVSDPSPAEWNSYVDQSPHAVPFHRHEALDCVAAETGTRLHRLVGFKGQEPVGVLPVFEGSRGPFTLVRSPPELELLTLGPAPLNAEKLKQRKAERRRWRFVEGCLDWLDERLAPDYTDIRTVAGYGDVRPFTWAGYDVSPAYTYVLEVDHERDALLGRFSRDARTNIRDALAADDLTHRVAGRDAVEPIVDQVRERHRRQGERYPVRAALVERLHARLPDDAMRVHVLEDGDAVVTGMVTYETDDTVYRWLGGAKREGYPTANDLLDWRIMRAARERGRSRYDLVGANRRRLCRYKSKFNPEPAVYYTATRRTPALRAASAAYARLPDPLRVL
jgi:hypothetical protein